MPDPIRLSSYIGIIFFFISALYLHIKRPDNVLYLDKKGEKKIDYIILILLSIIVGVTASIVSFFYLTKEDKIEYKEKEKEPNKKVERSYASSDIKDFI